MVVWFNTLLEHFAEHPVQLISLLIIIAFSKSTIFLSSILPPASIMLIMSISVGLPILPEWVIWIAITIGATAGSVLNFHFGRMIMHTDSLYHLVMRHETRFLHIRNKLYNNAILALFTSRFVAVLLYTVPVVAGMLDLRPIKVYCTTIVSAAVWSALYVSGYHIFYHCYSATTLQNT